MSSLNMFDILPGTFIQTALATKTRYDNFGDLYNLNLEVRWSLLDLLRIKKLSLRHGLVFLYNDTSWESVGNKLPIDYTYIGDLKVIQVSAGDSHSLFLCEDGSVFSSGEGNYGRLGDGDTSDHRVATPSPIDYYYIGDLKVIQVAAGYSHSLFLCEDGTVFSCGDGRYGRLGDGDTSRHLVGTPSPIDYTNIGDRKVIQVAAGGDYSLFLCEDGTVFSFGIGVYGTLGDGNTNSHRVGTPSPIDITYIGDRKVMQVSAGNVHSLLVCEDSSVFSFGMGVGGRLGDGDTSRHKVGTPSPIDITYIGECKVIQVSAGRGHSLFLCEDGSVFSSGWGANGMLGDGNDSYHSVGIPSPINNTLMGDCNVIQVAAGPEYSLFLCRDGTVFSSGLFNNDITEDGDIIPSEVAMPSPIDLSLIGDKKVIQVAAGEFQSFLLT